MTGALAGKRIVVPETRELDLFVRMLEEHGATTVRCPLVSIHDVTDATPVADWLARFVAQPPDDLVVMTGEGLERLVGFARRAGMDQEFVAALARVRKVTRGPKPVRRLRALGLNPDVAAAAPTTAGVIAALAGDDLAGRRVAIQLYPGATHSELIDFLTAAGATPDPVLCYVYGSQSQDGEVLRVIDAMAAGQVDVIAFTSSPQVRRLIEVARAHEREAALRQALARTMIAAVGPVVARAIEAAGGTVSIAPADSFHLKPMVSAIITALNPSPEGRGYRI
jgi:uroporphyrinogen-III synthase